ncbi:MAG: hypothetical protein UR12_C0033G0003 [candidate division TM6 bacterium GW2011_GWF2_30_66]|jgi:hypothetical protein|nr:MAG: hypothetical protein UR12_C0033G0003 [candidate division TM6 bacterium GW2011_GWF2_30_66]
MIFFRKIKLFIFVCVLGLFFCGSRILSKGIVYIYTVDCNLEWASTQQSKGHYIHEIRDGLKRLGYAPIFTRTLDGLGDFDKLVLLSVVGPWAINSIKKYPKEKVIAFLWEPPVFAPDNYEENFFNLFSKVYTWDDSLVDNVKFFHYYYPDCFFMIDKIVPFNEKKLCVMMNANKDSSHKYSLYGERRKVIQFFEYNHSQDFDLYGSWWTGLKNYRGYVNSKVDCMKNYRFCYAYENMCNVKGYVTEKIFNAFTAGCVPIYWGADNITDYIPKNCFIDRRDFTSDEQLYQFLKNMTEGEYQVYINDIKCFLNSDLALVFSHEHFVDIFLNGIEPGYDKTIALTVQYRNVLERLYKYLGKSF